MIHNIYYIDKTAYFKLFYGSFISIRIDELIISIKLIIVQIVNS